MVDRLARELRSAGIDVWTDRDGIKPGMDWRAAIEDAIGDGAFFVPCFTNAYANREHTYMDEELDLAGEQLRLQRRNRSWFIPVVFSGGKIPDRVIGPDYNLQHFQWVDLDTDWGQGINTLVNAVLEKLVRGNDQSASDRRTRARAWKRIARLADQLTDPTASVEDRRHAAEMLEGLAPEAAHVVPALQRALDDDDEPTRTFAMRALVAMGDGGVGALVAAIGSPVADIRAAALSALQALGPRAAPYTDRLIEAMASASDDARPVSVSDVLASIGEPAVPQLIAEMERRNPRTLHHAASALARMAPPQTKYAEIMKRWLRAPEDQLRHAATTVVSQWTRHTHEIDWADAVVPLAEAIREPARSEGGYVGLRNLGPNGAAAVPTLIAILREKVDDPRSSNSNHELAQRALANIGAAAIPALAGLILDRQPAANNEEWYCRLVGQYDGLWAVGWIHARDRDEQALALLQQVAADTSQHIWLRAHAAGYLSDHVAKTQEYMRILAEAALPSATHWDAVSKRAIEDLAAYDEEATSVCQLMMLVLESNASEYVKHAADETLRKLRSRDQRPAS